MKAAWDVESSGETAAESARGHPAAAGEELLTEPVLETVRRDLLQVYTKLRFFLSLEREDAVLLRHEVRNYELWGPFLFYLAFAALLVARRRADFEQLFSAAISFLFLASVVLTLNTQLLRGKVTFCQGLCVVGYSVFPMTMAAAAAVLLAFLPRFVLVAVIAVAFCWSVKSAHRAMRCLTEGGRQMAATLPFALFHAALAWFVLLCG